MKKQRGVFEKVAGSGIWWICYYDADGRRRREIVGSRSAAIHLYRLRKAAVLEGRKLPQRKRVVLFNELASDALEYSKAHKLSYDDDVTRMARLSAAFGSRSAESITAQDIERWLNTQEQWAAATANRYKALLSLAYSLGVKNGKVAANPAKLVPKRRENNARERYLLESEESMLRAAISARCPERIPELDIALNTGLRRSEQYDCEWGWINFERRIVTVPRSKHGEKRHVYLNEAALAAFRLLEGFSNGSSKVFAHLYQSPDTKGPREWFESCLRDAGIQKFRWHDLRHTFASRLVMVGVDIVTVQAAMGHKTIQMTLRYSHLAPKHQLEAVRRLDKPTATRTATEAEAVVGYVQ